MAVQTADPRIRDVIVQANDLRGADGQVIDQAKYTIIWKREASEWKLHRDIFNLNGAASQAGRQQAFLARCHGYEAAVAAEYPLLCW
jgi:hypothetical protein